MRICERSNAQTVLWIQLALEKLTTNILNLSQLEQTSSWQQALHVTLFDDYVTCITKVNEQFHCVFVDVSNRDFGLTRLFQFACEHGSKVW